LSGRCGRGLLVIAVHTGGKINHVSEWFGREVDLDGVLFEPETICAAVASTGLGAPWWYHRGALPGRGEFSDRFHLLARPPAEFAAGSIPPDNGISVLRVAASPDRH
jgi:hypothetical protein